MNEVSLSSVNQLVLQKQHLAYDSKISNIPQIADDICALHATGPTTPYLSLFARNKTFLREHLDEELYEKRRLGRIRCMRGTLHILTKEVIPVAFAATRRMIQKGFRDFLEFRGVSTKEYCEASKAILGILKGREMTTSEVKESLGTPANLSAIVELMCDQGLLVRGKPRKGWKDRVNRYSIFHEYFPDLDLSKMEEAEARTLLVQRYLRSFGPATENDIAWWIGLSKVEAREALSQIKNLIDETSISGIEGSFIMMQSDEKRLKDAKPLQTQTVNLLPALDPYLMGYKDRERYLPQERRDNVFDRSGNATSTILLDGRVVGVWDFVEEKKPLAKLLLFEKVKESAMRQIHLEAQRIGRFMADEEVQVRECDSMIPLTQRTAGGFMSPLKTC